MNDTKEEKKFKILLENYVFVSPDLMSEFVPSPTLSKLIGDQRVPKTQAVRKLWEYIKKNNLQDAKNRRNIIADNKLKEAFGKPTFSFFEMNDLLNDHLAPPTEGVNSPIRNNVIAPTLSDQRGQGLCIEELQIEFPEINQILDDVEKIQTTVNEIAEETLGVCDKTENISDCIETLSLDLNYRFDTLQSGMEELKELLKEIKDISQENQSARIDTSRRINSTGESISALLRKNNDEFTSLTLHRFAKFEKHINILSGAIIALLFVATYSFFFK